MQEQRVNDKNILTCCLGYVGHHSSARNRDPQGVSDTRSLPDNSGTLHASQASKEGDVGEANARSTFVRDFYAKSDRCAVHCCIFAPQRCLVLLSSAALRPRVIADLMRASLQDTPMMVINCLACTENFSLPSTGVAGERQTKLLPRWTQFCPRIPIRLQGILRLKQRVPQ